MSFLDIMEIFRYLMLRIGFCVVFYFVVAYGLTDAGKSEGSTVS